MKPETILSSSRLLIWVRIERPAMRSVWQSSTVVPLLCRGFSLVSAAQ